jgi:hypothetical protein
MSKQYLRAQKWHLMFWILLFSISTSLAEEHPLIENQHHLKFLSFQNETKTIKFKGTVELTGLYVARKDVDDKERARFKELGIEIEPSIPEDVSSYFMPDYESLKKLPRITETFTREPESIDLGGWKSLVKVIGIKKAKAFLKSDTLTYEMPAKIVVRNMISYSGCQGIRSFNANLVNFHPMPQAKLNISNKSDGYECR